MCVVPASSVVGLHVSTSITSETAKVEDRVEARVTRDVIADGRVAIPAGTKVIGDVTLVERGGKMKDKARLGVRFHTLVLADGDQVPFRTDAIFREGAGRQWDPQVIEAFFAVRDQVRQATNETELAAIPLDAAAWVH